MANCTSCGHELGGGRFCPRCGRPTAPVPPPPPSTPPSTHAGQVAPAPRFPLFADQVAPTYAATERPPDRGRRPRRAWPLAVAALALLLVVGALAGVALLSGDDDTPEAATPTTSPGGGGGGNLATDATATVPATAPPNQDVSGNPTTYDGANMLDGVPETCWRMPGDGTGEAVTVTLPEQTHLRRVGLINGYAKIAEDAQGHEVDWYHGNRRVLRVEWVFDDGTTVTQDLEDAVAVQYVDVDATTTAIELRLVTVSPPGKGRASRDYTAISDLSLIGDPVAG